MKYSMNPKYWRYMVSGGIKLDTQRKLQEAIRLGLHIVRLDRLMNETEVYDYDSHSFKKF